MGKNQLSIGTNSLIAKQMHLGVGTGRYFFGTGRAGPNQFCGPRVSVNKVKKLH